MRPYDDPAELSPEQCRCELAGIFAAGMLRLRRLHLSAGVPAEVVSNMAAQFVAPALRFREKPCSVSTRVNGFESPEYQERKHERGQRGRRHAAVNRRPAAG